MSLHDGKLAVFEPVFNGIQLTFKRFAGLGVVLIAVAKRLSTLTEFYYFSGASLGVGCAVGVLVLLFFYLTKNRSSPTSSQFGVAAILQASLLFLRKRIVELVSLFLGNVLVFFPSVNLFFEYCCWVLVCVEPLRYRRISIPLVRLFVSQFPCVFEKGTTLTVCYV
jgi:hypothetical protein